MAEYARRPAFDKPLRRCLASSFPLAAARAAAYGRGMFSIAPIFALILGSVLRFLRRLLLVRLLLRLIRP